MQPPRAAVIGALNIDLILTGLPRYARVDEQVNGGGVSLLPGGKGRNVAAMLAAWMDPGEVAMIGKLVRDRHRLYRIPLDSLAAAGIRTEGIRLAEAGPDDLPTLAIFLNTAGGQRKNYYLPGSNEDLAPRDIDAARPILEKIGASRGMLVLSLEMPLGTAVHALALAADLGLRVMVDPGGQPPGAAVDFSPLFAQPIFLLKPNHEEAARLTGVAVHDFSSASRAAEDLLGRGLSYLVITHGRHGAYAFHRKDGWHVPAPETPSGNTGESTGCGDQVMAVLCAQMLAGVDFPAALRRAVHAGSLQFRQPGTAPIPPGAVAV
jgi:ribokinase